MVRISSLLFCTGALLAGCASNTSSIDQLAHIDVSDCVKIEGADIGRVITLEIPDADGEGTVSVTFTGWIGKDGENNEFVGFDLDADAVFVVKAGNDIFEGEGSSFVNPNGTSGPDAKAISFVALCSADGEDEPPPPDCDLNDDGDTTDEGECDYVPPPPPPDCDLNDDGDTTDEGECDYVPPPPPPDCDHNDDGDTTDEGECDYVPPPDCDHNDDGDETDEGECHYEPPCEDEPKLPTDYE